MSDLKEMMAKKAMLKKGGAGASQKRVTPHQEVELKGSQVSVYFDAEDMSKLTKYKYKFKGVPRGKILKYALQLFDEVQADLTPSQIMGYKS